MDWRSALAGPLGGFLLWCLACVSPVQAQDAKPFSQEQIDQMTAPIALYPDSLLSQLLMATTYPDEFSEAYQWSKSNPDQKGDAAVKMVESRNWEPAVASMVAFPEVIITLGEQTDWVKNMGDAFLAQPDDVMNSIQRLRAQAQTAGNLDSNEQITVSTAPAEVTVVQQAAPPPQVITIEPAQPTVVYVPSYNPAVVYGPWPYAAYPPYYYPRPAGYWFSGAIATGIAWGVGIGISNALWGGCDWNHHDVDINVNRYNNINVNNRISGNSRNSTWNHNSNHRRTDYRGGNSTRQRLDRQYKSGGREQFRGRDASRERAANAMRDRGIKQPQGSARERAQNMSRDKAGNRMNQGNRDANRERAQHAMQDRGIKQPQGSARDRAQHMNRDKASNQFAGGNRDAARRQVQNTDRNAARQRAQSASRDNALRGANSSNARAQMKRGSASNASAKRYSGGSNRASSAAHNRPARSTGSRSGGGGGSRHSGRSGGGGRRR